jgi:hypothetical protein
LHSKPTQFTNREPCFLLVKSVPRHSRPVLRRGPQVGRSPWLSSGCALARQSELTAPQRPNGPHGAGSSPFPCSPCCSLLNVCSRLPRGLRAVLVSFCTLVTFSPGCAAPFSGSHAPHTYTAAPGRRSSHASNCTSLAFPSCKSHFILVFASPALSALHLCLTSYAHTDTNSRPVLVGPSPAYVES